MDLPDIKARIRRLDELSKGLRLEIQQRKRTPAGLPALTGVDYLAGLNVALEGVEKARNALERAANHWEDMAWRMKAGRSNR